MTQNSVESVLPSARQVRAFRAYLGMTQEDFARHVGIGVSTVYAAEVDLAQSRRSTLAAVALAMRMAGVQHTGGGLLMPP